MTDKALAHLLARAHCEKCGAQAWQHPADMCPNTPFDIIVGRVDRLIAEAHAAGVALGRREAAEQIGDGIAKALEGES